MARIRTIKPAFFRHRRLFLAEQESGLPLRIAFAGLWTCADREGRFRWEPEELKLDCLPYDEVDFLRVLDALLTRGFLVHYVCEDREYGVIPGFKTHQVINNREADSNLPAPPLIPVVNKDKSDASGTRDARDTTLHKGNMEGKGREGKGTDSPRIRASASNQDFEEFWRSYPKREGPNPRKPAEQKFASLVKTGIDPAMLVAEVKKFAEAERKRGNTGTRFIPQAVTWLNQQRWSDHAAIAAIQTITKQQYYAKADSPQLDAWDAYGRQTKGKNMPRDRNGGWFVDGEWPPGYRKEETELITFEIPQMKTMAG